MATKTFGIKLNANGPTGIPNGHLGFGTDVQVVYDDTKVTKHSQLKWALDELLKMSQSGYGPTSP
jgi:hypothetical protein